MKASLFARARAAPASPFLGFSPVSSHRGEKKKRSRMFGKICRSVEHFLHWCKRRGGQRGRGGTGRARLRGRAPGRSPPPHVLLPEGGGSISRFLSILDPFSGPAMFTLEATQIISPQQALRSSPEQRSPASPPTLVSQLPSPSPPGRHRSLRNRSGPSAETRPVTGLWIRAQTCPARTAWRGRQSCARPPLPPSHGTAGWQRARRGCLQ